MAICDAVPRGGDGSLRCALARGHDGDHVDADGTVFRRRRCVRICPACGEPHQFRTCRNLEGVIRLSELALEILERRREPGGALASKLRDVIKLASAERDLEQRSTEP